MAKTPWKELAREGMTPKQILQKLGEADNSPPCTRSPKGCGRVVSLESLQTNELNSQLRESATLAEQNQS
ncbi:TPA: hypothetical protein DD455_02750 [Candidatus Shapirobacteria bacterium]|nr:hypothetical protein [Candidatus Shapirobacteria bacterium]